MGHHNSISESIEMYLLRIALLQDNEQPVPVPRLAQELEVSPVSANEMCRKLTEKHLVTYEPYKGVSLTAEGETAAQRVLRHRRLWEVFFVEKLGINALHAEEMACRFEHVTPDDLAANLADFLGHPTHSPQNQPIPGGVDVFTPPVTPLAALIAGDAALIVSLPADEATHHFLRQQGLKPGAEVQILAATSQALLLNAAGAQLSLTRDVAAQIKVTASEPASSPNPILAEAL